MATGDTTAKPSSNRFRAFLRLAAKWILIFGLCYLGVLFVIWLLENRLVYFPTAANNDWQSAPSEEIEDVWLNTADGTKIHGWWHPHDDSDHALLFFHGNAGNLSHRGYVVSALREHFRMSVLIVDYPGYGKSEGRPSEKGCYAAADAAYQWLTTERDEPIPPKRIVIYGDSLGGGVAVHLASRKTHHALILVRTFTSVPDTAKHLHWWLPAHWIMCNRFNNLEKIKECRRPVFIAHGTSDNLIPYSHGKKLYEAAPGEKEFFPMPGADHNDPLTKEMFDKAKEFLDDVASSSAKQTMVEGQM